MKIWKTLLIVFLKIIVFFVVLGIGYVVWLFYSSKVSNPYGYKTVGDIPVPMGYKRISGDDAAYSAFLRSLPLKGRGAEVMLYKGGKARQQFLSYAVVDMPLLSNSEQCADVCMRLLAEYLYKSRQYGNIHFQDVNGNTVRYSGGASRKSFENYLRRFYGIASTYWLSKETKQRALKDMQPGDVIVYPANARPDNHKYGHAIMVVDVAENKDGKKAFLLAEGNTPARDIHVM